MRIRPRSSYIGGGDAARILGVARFGGPHDVFLEKTGRAEAKEVSFAMWLGLEVEPVLEKWMREKKGMPAQRCSCTFFHPDFPFIGGTPDGFINDDRLVSFKSTRFSSDWGEPGTDQVPQAVICQETHYMGLLNDAGRNLRSSVVVPLIGNDEPNLYEVQFAPRLWEALKEKEIAFWHDHILADVPPPLDGTDAAWISLSARFPRGGSDLIEAPPEIVEKVEALKTLSDEKKEVEQKMETLKQEIAEFIGDKGGVSTTLGKISWSEEAGRVSWKSAAEFAGVTEEVADRFRGEPSRTLRVSWKRNGGIK